MNLAIKIFYLNFDTNEDKLELIFYLLKYFKNSIFTYDFTQITPNSKKYETEVNELKKTVF